MGFNIEAIREAVMNNNLNFSNTLNELKNSKKRDDDYNDQVTKVLNFSLKGNKKYDECMICYEPLDGSEPIVCCMTCTTCIHQRCLREIETSMGQQNWCPVCRQPREWKRGSAKYATVEDEEYFKPSQQPQPQPQLPNQTQDTKKWWHIWKRGGKKSKKNKQPKTIKKKQFKKNKQTNKKKQIKRVKK